MTLSRRDWLKSLGVGAASIGMFGVAYRPVAAQTNTIGGNDAVAYYRFRLGSFEAMVIHDSDLQQNVSLFGNPNTTPEEVLAFFQALNLTGDDGAIRSAAQILVVNTGSDLVVFDTGFGAGAQQGGRLVSTLAAVGIGVEDVTKVVITHFHPDHITGLSANGALTFPNAMVYFPQPEFDFMEAAPADSPAQGIIGAAREKIAPAQENNLFMLYADGDSIADGITAMAAHGHTAGHMAVMIESDGVRLMNIADATIQAYAGLQNPDWYVQFDAMPDMAVETRKRVLGISSDERVMMFGYHFPFPALGYAVRQAEGEDRWSWVPAAF